MGASSSKESATKASLLGKRNLEDDLENKPIVKRHKDETTAEANLISVKEAVEGLDDGIPIPIPEAVAVTNKTLFVCRLPRRTKVSDIISFFSDVGDVVHVRLMVGHRYKHCGYAFVELASANQVKMALENKYGEYLHGHKILLYMADFKSDSYVLPKYCKEYDARFENYIRRERHVGFHYNEKVVVVANLSPYTNISDIKRLFKGMRVVSVRLIVNNQGKHLGYAFVEFASAHFAKKALRKKKNDDNYLHGHKIFLMREHDETPAYVEAVAVQKKTIFVSHVSPQTEISHIINFFKDVGEVVHVRLISDKKGRHVGFGFVEFSSDNEAEKALEKKNGEYLHDRKIVLDVFEAPNHLPKYKYCIDYNVWYEDYLRRQESLPLEEENEAVKGVLDETPDLVEPFAVTKKTLFVSGLSCHTTLSHIVTFFEDVGEVVRVRLIVDHRGNHVGCGFIEFASAEEAEEALEKKNGEVLRYFEISLQLAEIAAPYPLPPKYDLVEKLWYEDKLRGGGLDLATKPNLKKPKVAEFCGKKIIFSCDDD
ncbi:PREDICTED: polyadenylate-binding protein 2-like [Camelina sativa]|uniref:Polyadenylate-binding protein 2-like n=1 Tax=Camelina sativa TaxID=90675 RepID=A0ABM0Y4G9_CAMSA|nr:PREDICTED: polyadenylate-binding protein 2-like [Camelina sativa]